MDRILKSLIAKLIDCGIDKDNYSELKVIEVIERCCGYAILIYCYSNNKDYIKNKITNK